MYENNAKGSYGAYSTSGRVSAQSHYLVSKKDQVINPTSKKNVNQIIVKFLKRNKYVNIENDNESIYHSEDLSADNQIDTVEENIDIFQMDQKEIMQNIQKKKAMQKVQNFQNVKSGRSCSSAFHRTDPKNYKYHDLHMAQERKKYEYQGPTCTKYLPNKECVWKRTLVGPEWKTMTKRKPIYDIKPDSKFYINQGGPLKYVQNTFIDMKKQSNRGDCFGRKLEKDSNKVINRPYSAMPNKGKNNLNIHSNNKIKKDSTKDLKSNNNDVEDDLSKQNSNALTPKKTLEEKLTEGDVLSSQNVFESNYNKSNSKMHAQFPNKNLIRRPFSGRPQSVTTNFSSRPPTSNPMNRNNNIMFSGKINSMNNNIEGNINIDGMKNTHYENDVGLYKLNENDSQISSKSINDLDNSDVKSEISADDSYEKYKHIYLKEIKKRPTTAICSSKLTNKVKGHNKIDVNLTSKTNKTIKSKETNKALSNCPTVSSRSGSQKKNQKLKNKVGKKDNKFQITYKFSSKAPVFDKMISREKLDSLNDKTSLIPFSLPNFKQVRERPIMMVVYDRPMHQKKIRKEYKGIEPSLFYDPCKIIDKVNNHTHVVSPVFERKTEYEFENNRNYGFNKKEKDMTYDSLPSYMKNIFSREAAYAITDKTLGMNNYADGRFLSNYTSFFPKKSYNKIINLNLLNSKQFTENSLGNEKKYLEENNDYVAKSMKFYHKNYEDLLKECMLNKFDNITYKTIKKENKIDPRDVAKFLKQYEVGNDAEQIN